MSEGEAIRVIKVVPGGCGNFMADVSSPFKAIHGGMGSAKTTTLAASAFYVGAVNAPAPFLFIEPAYSMIDTIAVPVFEKMAERAGLPTKWNGSKKTLTIGRGKATRWTVIMRSAEKWRNIAGFEVGASAIDEAALCHPKAFERAVQRTRGSLGVIKQTMLASTPEGLANWFYDVCVRKPPKGMRTYRARTVDNPYAEDSYVENLRNTLSPQQIKSYLDGDFVNLTAGAVYDDFDRARHHRLPPADWQGEIVVGCDFNVDKMCWVIGLRRGDDLYIFDEVVGRHTSTYRQTEALLERLAGYFRAIAPWMTIAQMVNQVRVYTDATGARRQTSANESDVAILRSSGLEVISASSNPRIKDRVQTVSAKLRGFGRGTPSLFVDTERCPELTHSLQGQPWGVDGLPAKGKGDLDLSGAPDALGYLCWGHPEWRSTIPTGNAREVEVGSYL